MPNKITLKEMPGTVVHCQSKSEYDELMQIYEDAGWKWKNGPKPTDISCFNEYDNLCVRIGRRMAYFSKQWYESNNFEVLSFSEFKQRQGLEQKPLVERQGYPFLEPPSQNIQITDAGGVQTRQGFKEDNMGTCLMSYARLIVEEGIRQMQKEEDRKRTKKALRGHTHVGVDWSREILMHNKYKPVVCTTGWSKDNDGSISIPPPPMSLVQKVRNSKLNKKERALRKAGFRDSCGHWTHGAHDVATDLVCEDKREELEKLAEELNKEDEK